MRFWNSFSPSEKRKPLVPGSTMLRSMRRVHMRVAARSAGVSPISEGVSFLISSRYSQIAVISAITVPSSSSSAGIWPAGLTLVDIGFAPVLAGQQVDLDLGNVVDPLLGHEHADHARIGPARIVELHRRLSLLLLLHRTRSTRVHSTLDRQDADGIGIGGQESHESTGTPPAEKPTVRRSTIGHTTDIVGDTLPQLAHNSYYGQWTVRIALKAPAGTRVHCP